MARMATMMTITIGTILLPELTSGVNSCGAEAGTGADERSDVTGAPDAATTGADAATTGAAGAAGTENEPRLGIGVGAEVGALYPSIVSPETATFWNEGAPPPLFIIESMSERIVRIFTSIGGGGGALVSTLLKGFSISFLF